MELSNLTTGEKATIAGGALATIGAFMPWISAGPFTVSGLDGDGMFTLIFGVLAVGIVLFRNWETADLAGVGILGVLTILISGNVYNNLGGMTGGTEIIDVSAGFGLHLTLVGGLVLAGAAVYSYTQSGQQQHQQTVGGPR